MDGDLLLAIKLQEQFDNEYETSLLPSSSFDVDGLGHSSKKRRVEVAGGSSTDVVPSWKPLPQPERPLSIVDASWEMLDPNPDVRAMFLEFNDMFFWGKLSGVEVKWSPRMTLCAGVCSYEGRGGLCSIRLSAPLLKLRPRKDLVETLLHEMIHALLFVTQNNRDRDGHGPEFCKHMNRINKATGTKITVYHSFHDEVDVYRQHWWRCDGPCQNRRPYFGYVKRAMNRAPSSLDPWWGEHKRTCGGTYTKVKEPEGYSKKGKKDGKKDGKTSESQVSGKKKPPAAASAASASAAASSMTTAKVSGSQDIRDVIPFSGKGFVLGGKSQSSSSVSSPKKLPPPWSPAKSLTSPSRGPSGSAPSVRAGQKPPVKRSVGNTRAFVNINGSPVRIPKPHSSSRDANRTTQRSINDLFSSRSSTASVNAPSTANTNTAGGSPNKKTSAVIPKRLSDQSASSPRTSKTSPATSSKYSPVVAVKGQGGPAGPTQSKYFHHSNGGGAAAAAAGGGGGGGGGGQASRKRPWGDRSSGSSSIVDFFQKTFHEDSKESGKLPTPAVNQRPSTVISSSSSSSSSSTGLHNFTSSASSSSSSSGLMVSCPVCQTKVQESKINEHLDSCLS
ncbi:uncharacterized protein V6R79_020988 [Siganus canaliculatus]